MPYDLHKQPITHTYIPTHPDPFIDILLISQYPTHFSISYSFLDKSIYTHKQSYCTTLATRFSRELIQYYSILYYTILYKNDTITLIPSRCSQIPFHKNDTITLYLPDVLKYHSAKTISQK